MQATPRIAGAPSATLVAGFTARGHPSSHCRLPRCKVPDRVSDEVLDGIPAATSDSERSAYARCIEEIKKRIEVVNCFTTMKCRAVYLATQVECISLQIRKILELIALASMSANLSEYRKYRKSFQRDWNGKRILETLEEANPRFYPKPTRQIVDPDTNTVIRTEDIKSGFLTRDDYITLYDTCCDLLHADNPFGQHERDSESFLRAAPSWINKIIILLSHHQIQLIDDDRQIWVVVNEGEGETQVSEFVRVPLSGTVDSP